MNETSNPTIEPALDVDGFAIVYGVASADEIRELCAALGTVSGAGRRGLLVEPVVTGWAHSVRLLDLVRPYCGVVKPQAERSCPR